MQFLFPVFMFAAAWFLLVRPQQARVRAQKDLVMSLQVGDEIVTVGGLRGRISRLDDAEVGVDAAPGVELTFLRGAISQRIVPGGLDAPGEATGDELEGGI
ncbi:MAG TPA: preprotein translocase subunit YajC [Acidimicrobiales bacterium]|nr:preprotein translocase subunit YajC [Acidimicrobiales bacterium]